ncbi:MAG: hypothetical protein ACTS6P_02125 [Candidatus Hodgkinia cicadicola]
MLVDAILNGTVEGHCARWEVNYSEVEDCERRTCTMSGITSAELKGTTERRKWLKMLTCGECADGEVSTFAGELY